MLTFFSLENMLVIGSKYADDSASLGSDDLGSFLGILERKELKGQLRGACTGLKEKQ